MRPFFAQRALPGFLAAVLSLAVSPAPGTAATFVQEARLTAPTPVEEGLFGSVTAIAGDTLIVGQPPFDPTLPGAAFVFVRSAAGWSLQQALSPEDSRPGDSFGSAVAVSGDTIAVGASGTVTVFVRNGAVWSRQQTLVAEDAGEHPGNVVGAFGPGTLGLSGDTLVAGSPGAWGASYLTGAAYVFVRTGTSWSLQQKLYNSTDAALGDSFGFAVAVDGDTILAGAPGDDDAGLESGTVFRFERIGTAWQLAQKLTADDAQAHANFGESLALRGTTAVIAAPFHDLGAAYIFQGDGAAWSQRQRLLAFDPYAFFIGYATAIDGDTVLVGSDFFGPGGLQTGRVYAFQEDGSVWSLRQVVTASGDTVPYGFGRAVALSGETLVAGAPGTREGIPGPQLAGSVYVFRPDAAPDCSLARPSLATIWPPDHRLVPVAVQNVTDPDGDAVALQIDQIFADEPIVQCPDAVPGTGTAQLRADRSAHGDGRVYSLLFTATDSKGQSCQGTVQVCVPHNAGAGCRNGGAAYDMTLCTP